MNTLAALRDDDLRARAGHKGKNDAAAWGELIRRGVEHDPQAGKPRPYTGKRYADYEIRRKFER